MGIRKNPKVQPKKPGFLILYALCAIFLFGIVSRLSGSLKPQPNLHRLADLPIPKIRPAISLPEPLTLKNKPSNILGAEPIDPDDIVTYINSERMKQHVPPLKENSLLAHAAQMRADVIIRYQNFSHYDPYEQTVLTTVLPKVGYSYSYATENIGMGGVSAKDFVNGFMSSSPHRKNLLDPELTETGVGISSGPYRDYYVNIAVQLFGTPIDKATYLGYEPEDVIRYGKMLEDIGRQIILARQSIGNSPEKKEYYEKWNTILIRQQEILTRLNTEMQKGKPFTDDLVSLMKEYNANWLTVPKS